MLKYAPFFLRANFQCKNNTPIAANKIIQTHTVDYLAWFLFHSDCDSWEFLQKRSKVKVKVQSSVQSCYILMVLLPDFLFPF